MASKKNILLLLVVDSQNTDVTKVATHACGILITFFSCNPVFLLQASSLTSAFST